MTDISRIWISKRVRWNGETKTSEDYYNCDITVTGKDGISFDLNLNDEDTKKISAIVLPLIKKAIHANIEAIPDEL
ncbi:MAG: hypothetical protein J6S85_02225 [Methanobrevibacter sp.]|nr:hypothetical protein [Methanobrevibacter sp.]MBO7712354.1 hypothetical protein [Methanobrevibacter sp.]